jgi:hypothetical protein
MCDMKPFTFSINASCVDNSCGKLPPLRSLIHFLWSRWSWHEWFLWLKQGKVCPSSLSWIKVLVWVTKQTHFSNSYSHQRRSGRPLTGYNIAENLLIYPSVTEVRKGKQTFSLLHEVLPWLIKHAHICEVKWLDSSTKQRLPTFSTRCYRNHNDCSFNTDGNADDTSFSTIRSWDHGGSNMQTFANQLCSSKKQ